MKSEAVSSATSLLETIDVRRNLIKRRYERTLFIWLPLPFERKEKIVSDQMFHHHERHILYADRFLSLSIIKT